MPSLQINRYGFPAAPTTNETTAAPVDLEASRGRLPEYLVEPESAQDVAEAVTFARAHNLRLRVKNTGHD